MKKIYTLIFVSLLLNGCAFVAKHPELIDEAAQIEKEAIQDYSTPQHNKEIPMPHIIDPLPENNPLTIA